MFSNKQLQGLIEGKIIGSKFPYDTNNEEEIEAHIRRLFYRINRIPNIVCEAEWNHFGSGYASFIEFFCYRKEDVAAEEKYGMREIETKGMIIDICRLAPVAIMGEDDRSLKIHIETNKVVSGSNGTILDNPNSLVSEGEFQVIVGELEQALKEFNYELLTAEEMSQPLPFQAIIPTIYREPREYKVVDAIFYWED